MTNFRLLPRRHRLAILASCVWLLLNMLYAVAILAAR